MTWCHSQQRCSRPRRIDKHLATGEAAYGNDHRVYAALVVSVVDRVALLLLLLSQKLQV